MNSIRLKTKELQSKMYLTQTHRLIRQIFSKRVHSEMSFQRGKTTMASAEEVTTR